MRKPQTNELIIVTATTVTILCISLLAGRLVSVFDVTTLSIGIGIFIIILLGLLGLIAAMQHTSHQQDIDSLIGRLEQIIAARGFKWLYDDGEVAKIEGKIVKEDVWIVSPDFYHDLAKANFQPLTIRNFKKGIKYTYIVPESDKMGALILQLQQVYRTFIKQFKVKQIPSDKLRLVAVTNIAIYDPHIGSDRGGSRVFLELPIGERGYWIEVTQDAALDLIGRFKRIIDNEKLS